MTQRQVSFNLLSLLLFIVVKGIYTASIVETTQLSTLQDRNNSKLLNPPTFLSICTSDSDCQRHGRCKDTTCICDKGWVTWKHTAPCSYKQMSKLTTLAISFVLGSVGMDWFILSRNDSLYILCGILKCLILAGCCIWSPLAASSKNEDAKTVASCLSLILTLISFIWWIADWIRIIFNDFADGNGVPLV